MLASKLLQTLKYLGWLFGGLIGIMLLIALIAQSSIWTTAWLQSPHYQFTSPYLNVLSTTWPMYVCMVVVSPSLIISGRVFAKVLGLLGLIEPEEDSWRAVLKAVKYLAIRIVFFIVGVNLLAILTMVIFIGF